MIRRNSPNDNAANPMMGITIQTGERVIVWKGFDISTDETQDGIAFSKRMSDKMMLRSETLKGDEEDDSQAFSQKVSLAYDFSEMQSLSLEASEDDEEESVELRHKFRF